MRRLTAPLPPGSRVRLTGYFLRATGLRLRPASARRDWRVVACDCGLCLLGRHVAVDEPTEKTTWRHVAMAHLELIEKLPRVADLADAPEMVLVLK